MTTKLTPAERADLRQKAVDAMSSEVRDFIGVRVRPGRLLALLDEVERLHAELASVASARMRVDIAKFHKGDRHD